MLSILIPTYNYNVSELITSLNRICNQLDFDYEILCWEDGSHLYLEENRNACNNVRFATHHISKNNKGSITSRHILAKKSKYDWLLFLDADIEIIDNHFIENYSTYFNNRLDAIYGGCSYDLKKPRASKILRWKYGKTYEEIESKTRNKNPYKFIVSVNFIIKKNIFLKLVSKINADDYGYDIFLGALMKDSNTKVLHINNPIIHKGLDDNFIFLDKVERAVKTNYKLLSEKKVSTSDNSLLKVYRLIKTLKLLKIINTIFKWFKKSIKNQLLSNNPNVKLLQFYKLGYLCSLSLKRE
ncbi:glycosyltransferase family 2 protein [Winogradskyella sp.]|jgi:glycosyltransferase involved in cell wall biosynthesis|uniref:glycosyltransferase family A protein n=1 Tax=Winogradskyella sp. TaxID=1883156 RepID=UPI0025D1CEC8|nr:glycosyltransferase family 2 protein [Winogradskyella sp.]MCT4629271.1 glycosyltransferase family 2 protein [Winogradskyella sp.]